MSQCFMSLARVVPLWPFYGRIQCEREYLFQSIALFQWKCVRFQRTAAALDLPEHQIAPLCLCVHVSSQINTAQHTSVWVWGRQSATFHSILNSLYLTLPAHETLTTQSVWMGEWAWTHQNLWHYGLLLHFLLAYISLSTPPRKEQLRFFYYLRIFDWCIKQIITQLSRFLNYKKKPGTSTLALLR